jgi:enolase-phosphatase E1
VTVPLAARGHRAVLLDIEGTTTPIGFVHDVLFPYARARLREYLAHGKGEPHIAGISARLAIEHAEDVASGSNPPAWSGGHDALDAMAAYAEWLMEQDRKSPGLKELQGLIWERGYRTGELRGEVFPDVAPALRRWHSAGVAVAIYSSGSELAQRRLFESTPAGDLTPIIAGFFDTRAGAKVSRDSYRNIAHALHVEPPAILFVSDVTRELIAARAAGVAVVLSVRPGNPPQEDAGVFEQILSFDEID